MLAARGRLPIRARKQTSYGEKRPVAACRAQEMRTLKRSATAGAATHLDSV